MSEATFRRAGTRANSSTQSRGSCTLLHTLPTGLAASMLAILQQGVSVMYSCPYIKQSNSIKKSVGMHQGAELPQLFSPKPLRACSRVTSKPRQMSSAWMVPQHPGVLMPGTDPQCQKANKKTHTNRASWCHTLTLHLPNSPLISLCTHSGIKHMHQSFTLCCAAAHRGGIAPALISPTTISQIKAAPALSSFTTAVREQREKSTRGTDAVVWRKRERKRYHCSLKASRNVSIQLIQAYTRSGRAQDYCEENLGHIWSQQHSCHALNGHVKQGLQQGPLFAEEGWVFFFSFQFYNFPSLRCIFRQRWEYIWVFNWGEGFSYKSLKWFSKWNFCRIV